MTVPLSIDSPRRAAALRFGVVLAAAMKRVPIGNNTLGGQLGCAPSAIASWRAGNNLPKLDTALRLAEALSDDRLAKMVRDARSGTCEHCGKPYLNEGGGPKRFCTQSCLKLHNMIRQATPTRERAVVAERRLLLHMAAVADYCRGCEPSGVCRDAECSLRAVSPLPMASSPRPRIVAVAPAGPRHDAAWLASVRDANAIRWGRKGERERASQAMTERHAARTPGERSELARRISAGRRAG